MVVLGRQKVPHQIKPLFPRGIIGSGQIGEIDEVEPRIVPQGRENLNGFRRLGTDIQLTEGYLKARHRAR